MFKAVLVDRDYEVGITKSGRLKNEYAKTALNLVWIILQMKKN